MKSFFQEDQNPEESARRCESVVTRFRRGLQKMHELSVRDVEVAALAGVILWNEAALLSVENTEQMRSQIFQELHHNLLASYGLGAVGSRFGSLLGLIQDLNVSLWSSEWEQSNVSHALQLIEKEIRESMIISRIFNPNLLGVWEDIY